MSSILCDCSFGVKYFWHCGWGQLSHNSPTRFVSWYISRDVPLTQVLDWGSVNRLVYSVIPIFIINKWKCPIEDVVLMVVYWHFVLHWCSFYVGYYVLATLYYNLRWLFWTIQGEQWYYIYKQSSSNINN